ncbi:MAG TPA: HNH endonuclease [Acidimicrobiales bacterium]|nr:HNH endonuclease [Acidimicrobiales bacterium]
MPTKGRSGIQHFIYPLTQKSGYSFGDADITPANYWKDALAGAVDEWGLSTGFRLITPGDWVWAYFGGDVRRICGVGTVRSASGWRPDWDRHTVHIKWDKRLTARLKLRPIHYSDYRQQVQGAAARANLATQKVLNGWLSNEGEHAFEAADEVKFAQRGVTQRLGQQQFRADVLRAYEGACAISGCREPSALQAAHIMPVASGGKHSISNSILLRADLHNLFDFGLIVISAQMKVEISSQISDRIYRRLAGRDLATPEGVSRAEVKKALRQHRHMHSG